MNLQTVQKTECSRSFEQLFKCSRKTSKLSGKTYGFYAYWILYARRDIGLGVDSQLVGKLVS